MRDRRYLTYGLAFLLGILPFFPQLSHPGATFFYSSTILLLFFLLCSQNGVTARQILAFPLFLPLCGILVVSIVYTLHSADPYQSQHKLLRLLVATLLYLTVGLVAGRKWQPGILEWAISYGGIILAVGLAVGIRFGRTPLLELGIFCVVTILVVGLAAASRSGRAVLAWAIFCSGTLLAVYALWQQSTGYREVLEQLRQYRLYDSTMQREMVKTLEAGRALAPFGNPNHLAGYLLFTLWAGVLLCVDYTRRWQLGLICAGGLIQIVCIYRTYSRSGLLALLFSVAVLGVWLLGRADRALRRRVLLASCVVFLVLIVGLFALGGNALGGRLLTTSTIVARFHFFRQALSLISEHLPDGSGLESFRYLATRYIRPGELESRYPHNVFLGTAVESGLAGLLVLFWFSVFGLRRRARPPDVRSVVGWGTFGAFLLLSSIDFHNEIAEILFVFLALQGICDARGFSPGLQERGRPIFLLSGMVVGGLVWWVLVFCPYVANTYQDQGLDTVRAGQPAAHLFERAAYFAPRDAEIANNLGMSFRSEASKEARRVGLRFLRRAVELNPFQAYLHGDLAEALFEDGRVNEALAENETACRLFPKRPLYIRRKAKYLLALGRRDEWRRWTEEADRLEQQDKELRP